MISVNVVVVNKINSFLHTERIDSFHYAMFHGLAERRRSDDSPLNSINAPAASPVCLTVNSFRINYVIQPGLNLIATADVAESFQKVCAIRAAEVIISGVANIPYEAGKMAHWEDPVYKDAGGAPESILKQEAADSGLKWSGPALKEIVPYDGEALAEASPENAFSKTVAMEETGDELILRGTKESLEKYGMLWSDGAYCFREDAYMSLRKYFDPDYFTSEHLKL